MSVCAEEARPVPDSAEIPAPAAAEAARIFAAHGLSLADIEALAAAEPWTAPIAAAFRQLVK